MGRGCVRNLFPHLVSPVETTAVAHGGNPQDRAASPRPRCLPKTALHRFLIKEKTSTLFSTGCTPLLLFEPVVR
ncbi:MAG: hypothetical protein F6K65_29740 [Moorea sp. SIO3C2]|nr:hypothetical protein [Moorena sp. SIO3C2]